MHEKEGKLRHEVEVWHQLSVAAQIVALLLVSLKFPDALSKHFSLAQLAQSAACDTTALP